MRRAIILAGVSSLNVVVGFASQWYIFTTLGPGRETDAYFAALVIPTLVLAVVSGSLMHVLVPLLSVGDDEAFRREAWTFFQGIALGFGAVAVPLGLAAQWWVPLTVPGFGQEARDLTVHIVRVQLLGMVFTAATGVLWQFVDRFRASMARPGQRSLLSLSSQLYGAGQSVLNSSIAAPMVPRLAQLARKGQWREFQRVSSHRLAHMIVVTGAALVGIALLGLPVLTLLFGHGRFDAGEIKQLWIILLALGGVWIGGSTGQILASSFYAKGDTVTPTRIGVVGYSVGVVLKVGGFFLFGVVGIAAGSSLYILLNCVAMYLFLRRNLGRHVHDSTPNPSPALSNV